MSTDPLADKFPSHSPYNYVLNNPIRIIDPDGRDTVDVVLNKGKWNITNTQIVAGDDVFRVNDGTTTTNYIFSGGKYGERVNALNLENNKDYTLGVYHISGAKHKGTGFYVTPGGSPSLVSGSNKRLPDGTYSLADGSGGLKWHQPLITHNSSGKYLGMRGIKIHPSASKRSITDAVQWTQGCLVVCSDYTISPRTGKPVFNQRQSAMASRWANIYLGATSLLNSSGSKGRPGAVFGNGINHKLIQKTR